MKKNTVTLISNSLLLEYIEASELYDTFIKPFTDVVKAVDLTARDVLNASNLLLKQAITFRPSKKKEHLQTFLKNKSEIEKKWKELDVAPTDDLKLFAFLLAPQTFIGAQAAKAALKTPGAVVDYMESVGINTGFLGKIFGSSAGQDPPKSRGGGLLSRLEALFFGVPGLGESAFYPTNVLIEQDEDVNLEKEVTDYLDNTGLTDEFTESAQQFLDAKKQQVEDLISDYSPQLDLLAGIVNASDLEGVIATIENAEKAGFEISESLNKFVEIKQALSDEYERLLGDETFLEKVNPQGELTEQELQKVAKEAAREIGSEVTGELLDGVKDKAGELLNDIKQDVEEQLSIGVPEKGTNTYKFLARQELGKDFLDSVETGRSWLEKYRVEA